MSRVKKKRSFVSQYILEQKPSKAEKLADEDSYESRRKKNNEKKKKHKSVYQRTLEAEKASQEADNQQAPKQGGRLAEKIRKLNEQKEKQNDADKD
jgi:vacuolar-type H+-ATPase subunit I/STV1